MKMLNRNGGVAACALTLLLGTASAAYAQDVPAGTTPPAGSNSSPPPASDSTQDSGLGDIVVTAQRREQNIQDVPIAITTYGQAQLTQSGVRDLTALSGAVPNLTIKRGGIGMQTYIRGIGSNNGGAGNDEPAVGTYIDGVYVPASATLPNLNLNSVSSVEVLRGPQGTLFGRNSTGGVVLVRTKEPTRDTSAQFEVGYASYESVRANAFVNVGFSDTVMANFSLNLDNQSKGFGYNSVVNAEQYVHSRASLRTRWLFEPSANTKIGFSADYSNSSGDLAEFANANNLPITGKKTDYNNNVDYANNVRIVDYGGSLKFEQELGSVRFVNLASYRYSNTPTFTLDVDFGPTWIARVPSYLLTTKVFTEEAQLFGPKSGALDWVLGAYYYRMNSVSDLTVNPPSGTFSRTLGIAHVESLAGYGQATLKITPTTNFTAGLRYTHETNRADWTAFSTANPGGTSTSNTGGFDRLTWRLVLSQDLGSDVHSYISYNRGIKSGGFSLSSYNAPRYDPETLDAYEVGLKSELFGRTLRLNVAGFYYDYKNQQVKVAAGAANVTINAAKSRQYGVDADLEFVPSRFFDLRAGVGLLNSKYTSFPNAVTFLANGTRVVFDATGNRPNSSPAFTGNATASFHTEKSQTGQFTFSGTVVHSSLAYADPGQRLAFAPYTEFNASITWTSVDENWYARLWVNNLTDVHRANMFFTTAFGDERTLAPPRMIGITFGAKFGK